MTATMTSSVSTERPSWQSGHIPRLSYRNSAPVSDAVSPQPQDTTDGHSLGRRVAMKGLSIREIREALPKESATSHHSAPSISASQTPKNKKSIFGGLFVKEPTMMALDQVAQQMIAQHGSISPRTIPCVSSAKMPGHVPKVNSKWDGVPEHVKTKEKQERERARAAKRNSLLTIKSQSRSTDIIERAPVRRRLSMTGSTAESWDSRSTGSQPTFQDDTSMRPESLFSSSSGDSIKQTNQAFSETSQPFVSTAGSRSTYASFSPSETSPTHPGLQRARSSQSASTQITASTSRSRLDRSPRVVVPPADAIPEYTSSPTMTPVERSPRTPALLSDDEGSSGAQLASEPMLIPSGPKILPVPVAARRTVQKLSALITSDAKLTEPIKTTSRAGLGIETAIVVRKDPVPREPQNFLSSMNRKGQSPYKNTPTSPLGKGRFFSREKK